MSVLKTRKDRVKRAHARVRKVVVGTAERPRLAVSKSGKHIYAQLIDDVIGHTLVSASSLDEEFKATFTKKHGGNCDAAKLVGKIIAKRALGNNLKDVTFDRGGHSYHGRVRFLAEAAREEGLNF